MLFIEKRPGEENDKFLYPYHLKFKILICVMFSHGYEAFFVYLKFVRNCMLV
jgi:hypothetical protein